MTRIVAGSVALLMVIVLQVSATRVANAADNSGSHICLLNSSAFCVDLKDDQFTLNQTVYLWNQSTGNGLGWKLLLQGFVCAGGSCGSPWPFVSGSGFNNTYSDFPVYLIEKTLGSNSHDGCLGEVSGDVVLRDCPNEGNDSSGTLWVKSNLINPNVDSAYTNVLWSDQQQASRFLTAESNSNGAFMSLEPAGIFWQQWTVG